jgi:hypothetical protein
VSKDKGGFIPTPEDDMVQDHTLPKPGEKLLSAEEVTRLASSRGKLHAFPCPLPPSLSGLLWRSLDEIEDSKGMTLRDAFALAALAGMHARDDYDEGLATPEQRAHIAYVDADAMLKEREKTK